MSEVLGGKESRSERARGKREGRISKSDRKVRMKKGGEGRRSRNKVEE